MKYILFLCIGIFLTSCGDSYNSLKCKEQVEENFPGYIYITKPTNSSYTFIVLDKDSSIWYVETNSFTSTEITEQEELFSLKKR